MKYCSKCGSELKKGVSFCENCGEKVEHERENISSNKIKNYDLKENIMKFLNLQNKEIENEVQKKIVIARYCISVIYIIGGIFTTPRLKGFLMILIGLSLMPITYKILKDKIKFKFKGMQVICPLVLIIGLSLISSISSNSYLDKNYVNNNDDNQTTIDNNTLNNDETLEEKWNNYYKIYNIEVTDVDSITLYNYGLYYKNKTVLTGIEIESKSSTSIKAKTGNNDSIFFSFVFNFEDKNEIKKYKEGDTVVIIGEVSTSTNDKTVTLNRCHVVLSNDEAKSKIEELNSKQSQNIEYAKELENSEKQAEADKKLAEKTDYISKCEAKNYQDILRNPNNYKNQYIKVTGKVIQVSNGWFNSVTIRLNDSSNDTWYISYTYESDNESKILEGDNISVYGESTGTKSYTAIFGNQITIPSIDAKYVDIN